MAKQNEKSKEEKQDPTDVIPNREECFIITPIGSTGSDIFTKAMGLIDAVIQPVLDNFNMLAIPANRMEDLGSINKQLLKRVLEDKLVIANLTGLNPNVMYELAVRHAVRKPVIIMAEIGTDLPFDISDQRTIFYSNTFAGVEVAKKELGNKIRFALQDEKPDNPIYSALQSEQLLQQLDPANPLSIILERLDKIEARSIKSPSSFRSATARFERSGSDKSKQLGIIKLSGSTNPDMSDSDNRKIWSAVYETIKSYYGDLVSIIHPTYNSFETNVLLSDDDLDKLTHDLLRIKGMRSTNWSRL